MEGGTMSGALEFFGDIAGQTVYLFLLAGAAFGLLVGILLVLDSRRVLAWNARLSGWVSTGEALGRLDQPRDIKRFVYRRHRLIGLAVVAGSLYALDILTFGFEAEALARAFRDLASQSALAIAFETLRLFFILGNLAALAVGVVLAFRPSLLKGIEAWADRYYGARFDSKSLDEMRFQPDRWVARHPRLAGTLVALGSAYVLVSLGLFAIN